MALLSRAQIDMVEDLGHEEHDVPEWGGSVRLRKMTAGEHARLGEDYDQLPKEHVPFYVLSQTLVDDAGAPLFHGPEGIAALARKAGHVIGRLCKAAARLNGLGEADVEGAAKN